MSDNTYPSNTTSRDYKTQFQKKAENAARRASLMDIKVFQLKIQSNHLNQTQKQFLNNIFLEANGIIIAALRSERSKETNLIKTTAKLKR